MNINFINFIQEIKSAESNQQQDDTQTNNTLSYVGCSACKTILNPFLFITLQDKDEPETPTYFKSKPTRIYICPNPSCPSIVALEGQRKLYEDACDAAMGKEIKRPTSEPQKKCQIQSLELPILPTAPSFIENVLLEPEMKVISDEEEEITSCARTDVNYISTKRREEEITSCARTDGKFTSNKRREESNDTNRDNIGD